MRRRKGPKFAMSAGTLKNDYPHVPSRTSVGPGRRLCGLAALYALSAVCQQFWSDTWPTPLDATAAGLPNWLFLRQKYEYLPYRDILGDKCSKMREDRDQHSCTWHRGLKAYLSNRSHGSTHARHTVRALKAETCGYANHGRRPMLQCTSVR